MAQYQITFESGSEGVRYLSSTLTHYSKERRLFAGVFTKSEADNLIYKLHDLGYEAKFSKVRIDDEPNLPIK